MSRPLILIGGGGHCKSVIEACRSCGRKIAGIFDIKEKVGQQVLGVPIIATEDEILRYVNEAEFIITVGFIKDPTIHNRISEIIKKAGGRLGTVIASTAQVSPFSKIAPGTVVLHGACINADACVGENVILNTLSNIEHDAIIADNCHISTCASINGKAKIGRNTFIGSHAAVCQCVEICENVVIGAGSVVTSDITIPGVYVGSPARIVDRR